jgi:hypothetical protein
MWNHYFNGQCSIFGIDDMTPGCKNIQNGGHMMDMKITSFKSLFNHMNNDGVYLCEDICTSYWGITMVALENKIHL